MKSFIIGLLTILLIGIVSIAGFFAFKQINRFVVSPVTPSATPLPSTTTTPTLSSLPMGGTTNPTPSTTPTSSIPAKTYNPGKVKGTTTTRTVTTTSTHLFLTVLTTNKCPATYTSEVKNITGPLTFRYSLKEGYSAKIVAWKNNGEEILPEREIKGSGELMKVEGVTYVKLQIKSTSCSPTSDNWITVTAER